MACTSSNDTTGDFQEAASAIEGIYQVSGYTRNDSSCAPGGESILHGDRFIVVFQNQLQGHPFAEILSCSSADDCRAKVAASNNHEGFALDFSFVVEQVGSHGELLGQGASTGFGDGEICREAELTSTTVTVADEAFHLQQKITVAADYPVDDEGFCSTTAAQQAAEGALCSKMETLTATFFAPL